MTRLLPPSCHRAARLYAATPRKRRDQIARVRRYLSAIDRVCYPPEIQDACEPYRYLIPRSVQLSIQRRAERATPKVAGDPWTRLEQAGDLELQAVMVALYLRDGGFVEGDQVIPFIEDYGVLTLAWSRYGLSLI